MTDKPNSYVLGKGRLYFEPVRRPAMHPALGAGYEATVKFSEDIYEWFVNEALFDFRVISIVGYNPQMLLPAPSFEDEFMQSMAEWAAEQIKLPYAEFAQSVFNTLTRDGEVTFSAPRYLAERMDFEMHSGHVIPHLLDEIARVREEIATRNGTDMRVIFVHADYSEIEKRMIASTLAAESAGGMPSPRGRVTIYDYDDCTMIELEGSGELPGRRDIVDDLFSGQFARQMSKTASMTAMIHKLERRPAPQKSYLDHDPTKRHKRRKKK